MTSPFPERERAITTCGAFFTHVGRDLLEPFVGGVVEVDLAGRPQVPRGLHEIAEESESDDRAMFSFYLRRNSQVYGLSERSCPCPVKANFGGIG